MFVSDLRRFLAKPDGAPSGSAVTVQAGRDVAVHRGDLDLIRIPAEVVAVAAQHGEQMGTAKLAIELAHDVGLAQARNVERLANSALMLNPDYLAGIERCSGGQWTAGPR